MPKAKPVSLHPLSFEEAIKGLIRVVPAAAMIKPKTKSKAPSKYKRRASK